MQPSFNDLIAGAIALGAVGGVVFASIAQSSPEAMTALVGIAGAVAGYYLRGKLQTPTP